jgi:hypothetical protein
MVYGSSKMIVYLDGENVTHQLMDALRRNGHYQMREDLLRINLVELIKQLVGPVDFKVKYYTTSLKLIKTDEELEKRTSDMIAWTALWTNHLMDQGIEVIKAGKLMARDGIVCKNCGHRESVFREKGVDVRIAVDLLVDSQNDKTLVIWSSDADLLPAIEVIKNAGARIKNLAHKDALNWGLARQCGEWQTYTDRQLMSVLEKVTEGNETNDGN